MLINNLKEYKQKYSNQRIPIIESVRSVSHLKSPMKNSKTQIPRTLRQKNQSQKILNVNYSKMGKNDINHQSSSNKISAVSFKEAARLGSKYENSKTSTKTNFEQFAQKNLYNRASSHQKTGHQPKNNTHLAMQQCLEQKQKVNKTETSIGQKKIRSQQYFRSSQPQISHKGSVANKIFFGSNYTEKGKMYSEDLSNGRYGWENFQRKQLDQNQKIKQQRIIGTKLSPRFSETTPAQSQNRNFLKKVEEKKQKNIKQAKNNSNYKLITIDAEKTSQQKQQQQRILKDLQFNEVFFCAYCFRYIFAIQKNYHYPKCQNMINLDKMSDKQKYLVGEQKLQILVQLAQYTKYKSAQIKQLYTQIIDNRNTSRREAKISGRSYYTLLQIQTAADIIFANLLAPYLDDRNNKYLCDNIKLSANSSLVYIDQNFDSGRKQQDQVNASMGIKNNYY